MWYVTCHVQKDGRVNLGTAKHAAPDCSALKGRIVHHIEGAVIAEIPSCSKCAAMWKSSDPYHLKHGDKLKPLNMTCDTTVHLLIQGRTPCDMAGLPCDWPPGNKWLDTAQWKAQAPLGEEPIPVLRRVRPVVQGARVTNPVLIGKLRRALRPPQSCTVVEAIVEDIERSLAWVEAVEVDEAPEQFYARLVVCHSYPEGTNIQPYVRAIVDKHHRPAHVGIEIQYRRVEPGYELENRK